MNLQIELNIFIRICVVLYVQTVVTGFYVFKINTLSEDEFIPKLLKIIKEGDSSDGENTKILNHIAVKRGEESRRIAELVDIKKKLVKRIIPHSYKIPLYEYDKKYNTYYRPLVRIHRNKPIPQIIHNIMKHKTTESHELIAPNKNNLHFILKRNPTDKRTSRFDKLPELTENALLEPSNVKIPEKYNIYKTGKLEKNTGKTKMYDKNVQNVTLKDKIYTDLLDLLKYINGEELRRAFDKSGEANDPLAPSRHPLYNYEYEVTTEKGKKWLPPSPFWTYWTYDKILHEDDCKGNLMKYNGVCIGGASPH